MTISRRSFLVGASALITASFVQEATACPRETGEPLLLPPLQVQETLFVYAFEGQLLITLGEARLEASEPPSWAEYLQMEGHSLNTLSDCRAACRAWSLEPWQLRQPLGSSAW